MRHARWLDHLPLWAVYGAVARTGIYEPWELAFMAAPLLAALLVEWRRWDLARWRLPMELATLGWAAFDFLAHPGFFGQVVRLLFLLSGLRLALPRQPAQRRQLLLMGFLLFLTTAVSNTDLEFFGWTLVWMLAAVLGLLQLAWEQPAALRPGPSARPPFRLVPLWALGTLLMAGGFFLALPRLNAGWRPLPAFGTALGRLQAGLSDQVDLGQQGPISGNHEVVLRIVPDTALTDAERQALAGRLSYLRGITLERVQGQRWEAAPDAPQTPLLSLGTVQDGYEYSSGVRLELFLNPTPRGVVPLPYGTVAAATPFSQALRRGEGGSVRLPFPLTRGVPLKVVQATPDLSDPRAKGLDSEVPLDDARQPAGRRLARLLELQPEQDAARRASLAWAPGILRARPLAETLARHLRGFTYTLDNPSAAARNPLEDFLDHAQAGHCEYFASAMALMLRARGVPARVVNGYRLGDWVPEGGYWLVTQDEAHAWTEYWDEDGHIWRMVDSTPSISVSDIKGWGGTWARLSDAMAFRWNRYVVRFSGEDQAAGFTSLQTLASGLANGWSWSWKRPSLPVLGLAVLLGLGWAIWRFRPRNTPGTWAEPKGSKALAPLLRRARRELPPEPGETARAWLLRLAALRPERAVSLRRLAEAADLAFYGGGRETALRPLVKAEAKAWK